MDVLANFVTLVHLAYFVFVVGGFLSIIVGAARRSGRWIFNPWFRIVHLLSVWVVLVEDVIGVNCPLNALESTLRSPRTKVAEASSGVGYLLDQLLHHTISERVLEGMYWTIGLALLLLLFFVPPHFRTVSPGSE
jgi:Protein of Unknown function (DUF2784)